MNNKIGIFSDVHLGLNQDNEIWHNVSLDFAKWASETYKEKGIKDIVICGDIFHDRSYISVKTLSVCRDFFSYFKDFNIWILVGNHDCQKKDSSEINSISVLGEWKNITVAENEPMVLKTETGIPVSLIPWGVEYKDIPKTKYCFGHFEINSFYMNNFKVCERGIDSTNLFDKAKWIISGHFHKMDYRNYDDGKILYVGSPFQHNFGDINDKRGIFVFDLEKERYEFIENELSPKHYRISLSEIKQNPKEKIALLKNNVINFVVDEEIEFSKLSLLLDKLKKQEPLIFKTIHTYQSKITQNKSIENFESFDVKRSIEEFVDTLDVEYKDDIKQYIEKIYGN